MSKSIYERNADIEQPKELARHSSMTLKQAVDYLKGSKAIFSEDVYCGMLMAMSYTFQRDTAELERLIEGKEYWII